MRLAAILGSCACLFFVAGSAKGSDLPDYPCAQAGPLNPVYYESSSAEWSWAPDGRSLVYDRAVGDVSQLRVLHLASGENRCITSGDHYDTQPNWSPRGDRLGFVRQVDGVSRIFFLDVDTSAVEGVTDPAVRSEYPTFSRDGSRLAYVRFSTGNRQRWVVVRDLATADERVVFDSPFGLNNLSWSADGLSVLLYSIDDDGWNDLYAARADGSSVTRLTDNTVTDSYSAEYSPDGGRLLFGQGSENSPSQRWFNYDLYERDVATGAVRRLTWAFNPDDRGHYSPDGRTIGFTSRRSGYAEILLMDADGGNLRAVTDQPDGELAKRIQALGVAAGQAYFEATRESVPGAQLIGELAALGLTRQFIATGAPEDALVVARMGVATMAESWRAQTALGEALAASGDWAGARAALRVSLGIFPNQYQLVFVLGSNAFLEILDAIDGVWQERRDDLHDLAHRLRDRGDFLSSLAVLQRLDGAVPDDAGVLSSLAETQMMLGDYQAAIEKFERGLALDPTDDEARAHLERIRRLVPVP